MIRTVRVLLFLLAIAPLAAPVGAQDPLASKVTVDLKAVPPDQAFRVVGNTIGMKVTVDAAVTTPIDILVRDVSARTALTTMCESIECTWTASGGVIAVSPAKAAAATPAAGPTVVSAMPRHTGTTVEQKKQLLERMQAALKQPLPAGMKFENAPLSEVSARLSEALGLTVELTSSDPAIRTLSADFGNRSLLDALKAVFPPGERPYSWRMRIAAPGADAKSPSIMLGIKSTRK